MRAEFSPLSSTALVEAVFDAAHTGDVALTAKTGGRGLASGLGLDPDGVGVFVYFRRSQSLEWHGGMNPFGEIGVLSLDERNRRTDLEDLVQFAVGRVEGWHWAAKKLWLIPAAQVDGMQGLLVLPEEISKNQRQFAASLLGRALGLSRRISELATAAKDFRSEASRQQSSKRRAFATPTPVDIIWDGIPMQAVRAQADMVARSDLSILLQGPSGTGKDVIANYIHAHGGRSNKPFVVLNCAALSPNLVDAELFGYEKGAFTGADRARAGMIEVANGGTLFLDEIAELSLEAQAKLLRVLETGRLRPVGKTEEIEVNFRLLTATHKPLADLARQQDFREDLFFRICQTQIDVPSLAERGTEHFKVLCQAFSRDRKLVKTQLDWLWRHPWPGNVRQLRSVLHTAWVLSQGVERKRFSNEALEKALEPFGDPQSVPLESEIPKAKGRKGAKMRIDVNLKTPLKDIVDLVSRTYLEWHLQQHGYDRGLVSKALGMPRRTLDYKVQALGLTADQPNQGAIAPTPTPTSAPPSTVVHHSSRGANG